MLAALLCFVFFWALKLKQPHRLLARCRAFVFKVAAALAGRATVRTTTANAPAIIVASGGSLYYVWSVSSPDHSTVSIAGNMTNLNQIDKSLKELRASVGLQLKDLGERLDSVAARVDEVIEKLDDLAGGPAEDDQQNEVDAAAAKINADADSLTDAINPQQEM